MDENRNVTLRESVIEQDAEENIWT